MTCPKCQGEMRTYERNGVHVDQCAECRGLFLDRGELERLTEAESSYYREPPPRQEGHGHEHGGKPRKKRRNFLEEFFE